ncbi:MAG: thiamine pyrophosphate-binding protein [Selenomonadaceae bacterium]|nr:thiamine pyrophosphate-binding protein [Selenomonadaceae bacterium]
MDVNQTIVKVLEEVGVDYVFGGSGQVNASMLLALNQSDKIKTIIIQNEQAASFMAAGYAMFSKKLGVCFATGGPGAFNLFSGLAVAYSDSIPMLAITGYTSRAMRGKGALNESTGLSRTPDSQAMFAATTKKSVILEDAKFAVPTLEELIYTAFEGRPGPVHLHIPKDVTIAEVPAYRSVNVRVPKIFADDNSTEQFCKGFVENFSADKKPLLMVGYGCIRSEAKDVLEKLINTWQIPFVSTMDAKGYIAEDNPLSLGIVGTSGDVGANDYFHSSQRVLAVGNSFAENATFGFNSNLFDGKKLFHINIDRHEIDKVYASDFRLVSDAKPALESLVAYLEKNNVAPLAGGLAVRNKHHDEVLPEFSNGKMHPGFLVQQLSKQLPENAIIMGDAGGHMLWLSAYLNLNKNQWYQNPGSFGPMASHVNGSIGVACANPDRKVICACGDGDYLMAGFELLTCVKNNIPVVYVIFNNSEFNVIKKFLLANFGEYAFMNIKNPDYVKYAEACGAKGWQVRNAAEFNAAFAEALKLNKPCIIDAIIDGDIYPPMSISKT